MKEKIQDKGTFTALLLIVSCFFVGSATIIYDRFAHTNKRVQEEAFQRMIAEGEGGAVAPFNDQDHFQGNKNAPVVLMEYSDTECPYCKMFHQKMEVSFSEEIKNGNILRIYRHFPLRIHPKARLEAESTECAAELGGNDGFWRYLDALYEVTPSNDGLDPALLPQIAKSVSLDEEAFSECVKSAKYHSRVQKDIESGVRAGVDRTPSVIIWKREGDQRKLIVGGNSRFQEVQATVFHFLGKPLPPDAEKAIEESENLETGDSCAISGLCQPRSSP